MAKEKRDIGLNLKITKREKDLFERQARAKGLNLSGYIRMLLYADATPDVKKETTAKM